MLAKLTCDRAGALQSRGGQRRGPHGYTLLVSSWLYGNVALAETVSARIDPDQAGASLNQALPIVGRARPHDLVAYLLDHGGDDPNSKTSRQNNLDVAVAKGYEANCRMLRTHGAVTTDKSTA